MNLTRRQRGGVGEVEEDAFKKKLFQVEIVGTDGRPQIGPLKPGTFFHKLFNTVVKNLDKKIEKAQQNANINIPQFNEAQVLARYKGIATNPGEIDRIRMTEFQKHQEKIEPLTQTRDKYQELMELYKTYNTERLSLTENITGGNYKKIYKNLKNILI